MTEALLLVPSIILAFLLWDTRRKCDAQLEAVLRASELARKEQASQASTERAELLTRIQAPKDASFVLGLRGEKQYVGADDDEGYWEAERELNGSD